MMKTRRLCEKIKEIIMAKCTIITDENYKILHIDKNIAEKYS